jgi:DNA/RNA-binding domain of Phe-tRNA-synthetase-like protein
VVNSAASKELERHARDVEERLRKRYVDADRAALNKLPIIQAYQRHYRGFGQTYHVLRQLETVALKGKSLASRSTLVLAMFVTELETLLLTAGHDLDAVAPPLVLDCSTAGEQFVGIGGQDQVLRADDMLMRDSEGIISAVVYGPDQRTRLGEQTKRVMFTTYAPAGISEESVHEHLQQLAAAVRLASPAASIRQLALYG